MKAEEKLPSDRLIYSAEELRDMGFSPYRIRKMAEEGVIRKLNKKFYENRRYTGEKTDLLYACAYASSGVVCLRSAAQYYNLIDRKGGTVDVAIERKGNISTLPEAPALSVHHYTDERFGTGIRTVEQGGDKFRIYDVEKTVADAVYYRNEIGIGEMREILVNYLKRSDRDLERLTSYAERLKCGETMRHYLEMLA